MMSSDFKWRVRRESFCVSGSTFDVGAAKLLIIDEPREVSPICVYLYSPYLCFIETEPGVGLDLSFPLILATLHIKGRLNHLPIDGWHRIRRAVEIGLDELPCVVLSEAETTLIRR